MSATYTAVVQQDGDWWIGWVEEIPGVNSQGETRQELRGSNFTLPEAAFLKENQGIDGF